MMFRSKLNQSKTRVFALAVSPSTATLLCKSLLTMTAVFLTQPCKVLGQHIDYKIIYCLSLQNEAAAYIRVCHYTSRARLWQDMYVQNDSILLFQVQLDVRPKQHVSYNLPSITPLSDCRHISNFVQHNV